MPPIHWYAIAMSAVASMETWTIPCIRMEILLFRYSPYMLDAPGMEWTPRGQLYWPHANRGSNYEAFTDERYYGDFSRGVRFAKDGEEYYL